MRQRCVRAFENAHFETDIPNSQWEFLGLILPSSKGRCRPLTPLRQIPAAMPYIVKTAFQWRCLPECFPPPKTTHHIFNRSSQIGLVQSFHDRLRAFAREIARKLSRFTAASTDSQTLQSAGYTDESGYDARKKIKGRKRLTSWAHWGFCLLWWLVLWTPRRELALRFCWRRLCLANTGCRRFGSMVSTAELNLRMPQRRSWREWISKLLTERSAEMDLS